MIGKVYYERGAPVKVLAKWSASAAREQQEHLARAVGLVEKAVTELKGTGPRNVLIERADGTLIVRPFRGLRKKPPEARA